MGCINTHLTAKPSTELVNVHVDAISPIDEHMDAPIQIPLHLYPKQAKTLDQIFDMKGNLVIGKVVKVYDGDTITCIINNKNQWIKYRIRLSDIDTCELKLNTKNIQSDELLHANQSIECGKMAKARLIELITDGRIVYDTLNKDRSYPNTIDQLINDLNIFVKIKIEKYESKFGRQLGWIYRTDDQNQTISFNQILLDEHYAYPYNGGTKLTILEQLKLMNHTV